MICGIAHFFHPAYTGPRNRWPTGGGYAWYARFASCPISWMQQSFRHISAILFFYKHLRLIHLVLTDLWHCTFFLSCIYRFEKLMANWWWICLVCAFALCPISWMQQSFRHISAILFFYKHLRLIHLVLTDLYHCTFPLFCIYRSEKPMTGWCGMLSMRVVPHVRNTPSVYTSFRT